MMHTPTKWGWTMDKLREISERTALIFEPPLGTQEYACDRQAAFARMLAGEWIRVVCQMADWPTDQVLAAIERVIPIPMGARDDWKL